MSDQGGTLAFNVLDDRGVPVPFKDVEARAVAARVSMRGGCFCNPGAAEAAFGWPTQDAGACLRAHRSGFSVDQFAECLGPSYAVGALRISVGMPTNTKDIDRAIAALRTFQQ
jgi:selenocysteine lyase/cysteine desulfurase